MTSSPATLGTRIRTFWFRPISAAGFGMMRIAFAFTTFVTTVIQAPNVQRYYGPNGILPHELIGSIMRHEWRFSLLDQTTPAMTEVLFYAYLATLILVMLGIGTRVVLAICLILMYSFHEYATIVLDGGDTLTRVVGFILLLAPSYRTFTIPNLLARLRSVADNGRDQPPSARTMPIWPYRLLLWQMVCVYTYASYSKLTGPTWRTGSAVGISIHHGHFQQLPTALADWMTHFSPILGYLTILLQAGWALLILLPILSWFGLVQHGKVSLKRWLLIGGLLLHTGIFLTMSVGTFTLAVFTAYLGLLLDEDFDAIRAFINHGMHRPLVVLFDGRCGFCKKTVFLIRMCDWLRRVDFQNLHDQKARETYAPKVGVEALNASMHAVNQKGVVTKGFFAMRAVLLELPVFWPVIFLLYVPGIPKLGSLVYDSVARHRH